MGNSCVCVCVGAQVCGVSPGRMGNSCVCVGAQVCGVSPSGWTTAVCVCGCTGVWS